MCRVLLVNAKSTLKESITQMAKSRGFRCMAADDAIDALLKIHEFKPHVVAAEIDDLNQWGFELLPFVRRRFPDMSVIAVCSDDPDPSAHRQLSDVVVCELPSEMDRLLNCIEASVARAAQSLEN